MVKSLIYARIMICQMNGNYCVEIKNIELPAVQI